MSPSLLLALALTAIPPGEIKTIVAVEADIVFRESLPSLPDDFGDKKPKGTAFVETEQKLPELWAYSMANCQPCENAKKEIEAAKDLKFKVVWHDSDPPARLGLGSRPAFWWSTDSDKPEGSSSGRTLQGWHGLKHLQEQWQKTRVQPRKFSRSFEQGQSGASVQPDHKPSRAVARGSYVGHHSGHDCPSCGREQLNIQNDNGPGSNTHIHRCNHCGTSWHHADQVWSSGSGSRKTKSFLGITWQ